MTTSLIGQSIGRYHILDQLGEGGMATVYKAYDTRLERDVAIKIIRRGVFAPDQLELMLKRFEREAKSLAKLSHPNIVGVIDYGEYEESPYLVMVYLPGGTLKQRLGQPIPWQDAVRLLLPIAQALEYAHKHNIIHRDVKPANILLTENGQPMLSDFGIAKILETDGVATLTGTGVGIGTPEYMAPEQWVGTSTAQSDIYSLGVVLYEVVTGRKPYTADTPVAILLKQTNDQLPRPTQFAPNLPDAVEKILIKALAKNLQDRYPNMSEFLAALDRLNYQNDKVSSMKSATVTQIMDKVESRQPAETVDGLRTIMDVESISSPRKKTVWWPWAIGAGGLVCCFALAILFYLYLTVPTLTIFLSSTPTSISTMTSTFTPTSTSLLPTSAPIQQPTQQEIVQPTAVPPTISVAPPPSQFFQEEFDNGQTNWSVYYMPADATISTRPISDVEVNFEKGYLQFNITDTWIGAFAVYDPFEYTDVRVDAHVANYGRVTNDFALVCRYSEKGFYEFNIRNDGYYFFNYIEIGNDGKFHINEIYRNATLLVKKDANEYGLVCRGETFTMYVNGEKVAEISHSRSLFSGKIGVEGFSLQVVPVDLHVDWVKISQP